VAEGEQLLSARGAEDRGSTALEALLHPGREDHAGVVGGKLRSCRRGADVFADRPFADDRSPAAGRCFGVFETAGVVRFVALVGRSVRIVAYQPQEAFGSIGAVGWLGVRARGVLGANISRGGGEQVGILTIRRHATSNLHDGRALSSKVGHAPRAFRRSGPVLFGLEGLRF